MVTGTYRVIATYNGDANYNEVAGPVLDANEQVVVGPAAPTIATDASNDIVLGAGQLIDRRRSVAVSARWTPRRSTSALYDNATCSGAPVFQTLDVPYPASATTVSSEPYTPTHAGTYRWIAVLQRRRQQPRRVGCLQRPEREHGRRAQHADDHDERHRDRRARRHGHRQRDRQRARAARSTGATVTFRLYGPNDANCAGNPVYTSPPCRTRRRWLGGLAGVHADGGGRLSLDRDVQRRREQRRGRRRLQRRQRADDRRRAGRRRRRRWSAAAAAAGRSAAATAAAGSGVAPVSDVPRGTATISGKTGCQGTPFNVMVSRPPDRAGDLLAATARSSRR